MPFETIEQGLLALRAAAQRECSAEEKLLYLPLFGKRFSSTAAEVAGLEALTSDFLISTNLKRVCALFGDGGSGKSVFLQQFTLKLWREYAPDQSIPLFISLPLLSDPIHFAVEETLKKVGFNEAQLETLKTEHSFIFILDGYDEIHQLQNVYVSNRLRDWSAKTIISCRSQYLYNKENPNLYFMPLENEREQPHLLQTLYVAPFSETQIESYFTAMRDRGMVIPGYEEITQIPGLQDLITSPFLLKLTVEALPQILARYAAMPEASEERHRLTQTDLYKSFVSRWFERQEQKLKDSGQITSDMPDQKPIFWRYCQALALTLHKRNLSWLNIEEAIEDEQFSLYFDNDPETERLRSACPIKKTEEKIGFWHASLGMHFVAQTIQQESQVEEKVSTSEFQATLVRVTTDSELERPKGTIHLRLITDDPSALRDLAEEVNSDSRYKAWLFELIEHSKTNKHYAVGAANAISILNAARISFAERDFTGICIPFANLSEAFMPAVNLTRSDLTHVNFNNVVLTQANLSEASLTDARFLAGVSLVVTSKNSGKPRAFALSPDFKNIAAYADEQEIMIVNLLDGKCAPLKGHMSGEVFALAFSRNGLLASGSTRNIRIWDIKEEKKERCLKILKGHRYPVRSLLFREDGLLVSISQDHEIRLWDIRKWAITACVKIILGQKGYKADSYSRSYSDQNLAFGRDGLLASAVECENGVVRLWSTAIPTESVCLKTLEGHTHVDSLAFTQAGTILASAGDRDGTIRIWNVNIPTESHCVNVLESHSGSMCRSLAFGLDGLLASPGPKNAIFLWNPEVVSEYALVKTLFGHSNSVNHLVFDVDGRLVSSSSDHTIRTWDMQSSAEKDYLGVPNLSEVICLKNGFGSSLIFCNAMNEIISWNLKNHLFNVFDPGMKFKGIKVSSTTIDGYLTSGCGLIIAVSTNGILAVCEEFGFGETERIQFWDVRESRKSRYLDTIGFNGDWYIKCLAFSPKGGLAIGGSKGDIIWYPHADMMVLSGRNDYGLNSIGRHKNAISCLTFGADSLLAAGDEGGIICLWDIEKYPEKDRVIVFRGHNDAVRCLAFGWNGVLVSSGRDAIRLHDNQNTRTTQLYDENEITNLTFTQDGQWLIAGSENEILCWNIQAGDSVSQRFSFGAKHLCVHGNFLSMAHAQTIYTLDLTDFPRTFRSVASITPSLWLSQCNITNAKGLLLSTYILLHQHKVIGQSDIEILQDQTDKTMLSNHASSFWGTSADLSSNKQEKTSARCTVM